MARLVGADAGVLPWIILDILYRVQSTYSSYEYIHTTTQDTDMVRVMVMVDRDTRRQLSFPSHPK